MTRRQLATNIRNLIESLLAAEIALYCNIVGEIQVGGKVRVTWRGNLRPMSAMASPFASIDEYRMLIEHNQFSAILFDGALLQMSYDFDGGDLVGHRLSYHPCPVDADTDLLRAEPILEVIDMYLANSKADIRLRSPLRFDFDPSNSAADHPVVHAHFNFGHVRCPVSAPLLPSQFIRFVFRLGYPDVWRKHAWMRSLPCDIGASMLSEIDQHDLHFNVRRRTVS